MATDSILNRSYAQQAPGWDSPFPRAVEVAPSDTTPLLQPSRAIYIGVSGDVRVTTVEGDVVTFRNHPVGYLPGQVAMIHATGTTATDFVAVW